MHNVIHVQQQYNPTSSSGKKRTNIEYCAIPAVMYLDFSVSWFTGIGIPTTTSLWALIRPVCAVHLHRIEFDI